MPCHNLWRRQPRRTICQRIFGLTLTEFALYLVAAVGIVLIAAEPDESVTHALHIAVKLLGAAMIYLVWAVLGRNKTN